MYYFTPAEASAVFFLQNFYYRGGGMRIVLKYGGSSVATVEKIQKIADYLIELKKSMTKL